MIWIARKDGQRLTGQCEKKAEALERAGWEVEYCQWVPGLGLVA